MMNPERQPTAARTAKITIRFTARQRREIDDYCAKNGLTLTQFARNALKQYRLERAIGPATTEE